MTATATADVLRARTWRSVGEQLFATPEQGGVARRVGDYLLFPGSYACAAARLGYHPRSGTLAKHLRRWGVRHREGGFWLPAERLSSPPPRRPRSNAESRPSRPDGGAAKVARPPGVAGVEPGEAAPPPAHDNDQDLQRAVRNLACALDDLDPSRRELAWAGLAVLLEPSTDSPSGRPAFPPADERTGDVKATGAWANGDDTTGHGTGVCAPDGGAWADRDVPKQHQPARHAPHEGAPRADDGAPRATAGAPLEEKATRDLESSSCSPAGDGACAPTGRAARRSTGAQVRAVLAPVVAAQDTVNQRTGRNVPAWLQPAVVDRLSWFDPEELALLGRALLARGAGQVGWLTMVVRSDAWFDTLARMVEEQRQAPEGASGPSPSVVELADDAGGAADGDVLAELDERQREELRARVLAGAGGDKRSLLERHEHLLANRMLLQLVSDRRRAADPAGEAE